jgi:hypothetical protein
MEVKVHRDRVFQPVVTSSKNTCCGKDMRANSGNIQTYIQACTFSYKDSVGRNIFSHCLVDFKAFTAMILHLEPNIS